MSKFNGKSTSISKLALGMTLVAVMASAAHANESASYPAGSFAATQASASSAAVDTKAAARVGDDSAYPPAVAGEPKSDSSRVVRNPEIFLGA